MMQGMTCPVDFQFDCHSLSFLINLTQVSPAFNLSDTGLSLILILTITYVPVNM